MYTRYYVSTRHDGFISCFWDVLFFKAYTRKAYTFIHPTEFNQYTGWLVSTSRRY